MLHELEYYDNMDFTFHGDVLGTSNLFAIDMNLAISKLHIFYDAVYDVFNDSCHRFSEHELSIFLFSDSIFITGNKLRTTIENLAYLYRLLFWDQIFLRGATVGGRLEYEPRVELRNLTKKLPKDDVLYRSVALEKYAKGARLLVDTALAKILLPEAWLTDELYSQNVITHGLSMDDFRRRIVLHRE